jgi:uncharacterized protein
MLTATAERESPTAARRLRACHPIVDREGRCTLVYDLERTFVIEVPARFRSRLAPALAVAELDAPLAKWLAAADLLTTDEPSNWGQGRHPPLPDVSDVSLDMSGACNMGCVYCFEDAIKSRIGPMSRETAAKALDFAFTKAAASPRLALHFGSGEPLIRFDLLKEIVAQANARAASLGKSISYDLTTNATLVTDEIAAFLRDHPFSVRVSCDGPAELHDRFRPMRGGQPSHAAVERGLRILLAHLADRLTVNAVICGDTRLRDIWSWAKTLGILRLHVIKVGTAAGDVALDECELAAFRSDLEMICGDLLVDLRAGRRPVDYQPITKVVRRLMIPEPITRFCGVAGSYLGIASDGRVYPCFRHLGLEEYRFGDIWNGVDDGKRRSFLGHEAADVDSRPVCRDCWARYLCGGGCYADSVVYGPNKREPQQTHCPFWRTETEVAISFYDQMRREDPNYCLALFGDDIERILANGEDAAGFLGRRNCQ